MMTNYNIEEKEKYEIDILSMSKDKECVTAYIHFPNQWIYSFYIITAPNTLCYSGDLGDFVFRGNITAKQPLTFFNNPSPKYGYWHEKLETNNGLTYNGDYILKNILEDVTSYFEVPEEVYDFESKKSDEDISSEDINRISEYLKENEGEDVYNKFDELMDCSFEEATLENWATLYFNLLNDYPSTCEYMRTSDQFNLCCDNLSYFSGKILEKIGYFNKDN